MREELRGCGILLYRLLPSGGAGVAIPGHHVLLRVRVLCPAASGGKTARQWNVQHLCWGCEFRASAERLPLLLRPCLLDAT